MAVFKILSKSERGSAGNKITTYKCKNTNGTEFTVKTQYTSSTELNMDVENSKITMSYKCSIANKKPYYNMVDLGLSCKWGIANYTTSTSDVVSATFSAGKRLRYEEAVRQFSNGKQHLPSTRQIKELLTQCTWEFIDNPNGNNYRCYMVTGPNGNSIFLPCSDGEEWNLSSAWYLGADAFDAYLCEALQLNVDSRIVYPFERQYWACVRLVEDN